MMFGPRHGARDSQGASFVLSKQNNGLGVDNRGSIPDRSKTFSRFHGVQTGPRRVAYHSSPSCVEVKNLWSSSFTRPYVFVTRGLVVGISFTG
jgi:hypothetical protein